MIRPLVAASLLLTLVGCGADKAPPPSQEKVVSMCKQRLVKDNGRLEFADDVTAELEDLLWTVRGTTVQPRGDYHCTIEAKTGKIAVVSLVKY